MRLIVHLAKAAITATVEHWDKLRQALLSVICLYNYYRGSDMAQCYK